MNGKRAPKARGARRLKNQPKRFPRYARGEDVGKALEKIWRLPHLRVHAGRKSTEFIFQLPFSITKQLERRNLAVYCRLFPNGKKGWAKTLVKAYETAQHEGKSLKNRIGLLLQKMLAEAAGALFDEHKAEFQQDQAKMAEEQKALRKRLIRTGPPLNEQKRILMARRLAVRYQELLPQVNEIRAFIKQKRDSIKDSELRAAIARTFQFSWIGFITDGSALQHLLPIPGHDSRIETVAIKNWTSRQLRVGIIFCEELARHPKIRLGPTTIYEEYILPGVKLISAKQ